MKFLSSLRGEKLLADIKASSDPSNPARRKAVEKLIALGKDAIPMVI